MQLKYEQLGYLQSELIGLALPQSALREKWAYHTLLQRVLGFITIIWL